MRKSIRNIINSYLKGKATQQEEAQLFTFYKQIEPEKVEWKEEEHGNKEIFEQEMLHKIYGRINDDQQIFKPAKPYYKSWKIIAAATIFIIGITSVLFYQKSFDVEEQKDFVVRPGSENAILQLADGRTVYFDSTASGNLSFNNNGTAQMVEKGELIYSNKDIPNQSEGINKITIPRGGKFKVTLSDGTSIWLNASSSLTYPVHFSGRERRVKLIGEAYFEVSKQIVNGTKNERLPFIVETENQTIEVLGTIFNINAYPDEHSEKTTLIEGSVKVSSRLGHSPQLLKPGQQSILTNQNFTIKRVEGLQYIAWKQGDFTFDETPLEEIMRQIARWYDVDVVYEGNVGKIKFGGSISRSKDIQEILDVMKLTGIHFNLKGRRIMITP